MSLDIPIIGFGTWQVTGKRGYEAISKALSIGYRHIDTATMYGNEAEVGQALRDSGIPRDEVFITTKLPPSRSGHERETLEASLRALGVDGVDLWLIHWPPRDSVATWRQFIALRDEGLTRAIGVSNYSTRQLDQLIDATGEKPALNQIEWGPSLYDEKRQDEHRERGIVLEGYSPFNTTNLRNARLNAIAKAHGATPAQVVLRWHIQHDVVVIPRSVNPEHIAINFDVFGFTLTDEEMGALNGL